ncbi:MAG: hypothetical protein HEQ37_05655 [Acidovorax sp.]|nr:hypothetical protein [Acidovorax sp.]
MSGLPLPPDWLTPDWPAPAGVHALCTARSGGVSTGPYASCNLGDHVGDDPAAVRANRARLTDVLRSVTPGASPVFLKQVHGDGVLTLSTGHGRRGRGRRLRDHRCGRGLHHHGGRLPARAADPHLRHRGGCSPCRLARAGRAGRSGPSGRAGDCF